ncbi:esterase/lipase [Chryseomicrobium aureum]|uniref:alpha/beta hydrolase n=1 Tax=Chryseomicrobium aureum TaxID=1441723 RepID=UPI001959CF7F|nr:alpha/beta fold hydrolase [Chryseomicrobium aureum]MBM7707045.1 esterase/lipase [Chryseomicrobium aureum]
MKTGVLFIHGYTGAPYEVEPFVEYVAKHTDWTLSVVTLPGHGEELELTEMLAEDWTMEAEIAIRKLLPQVDRLYVVGFSMGGLIAMYLSLRYPVERLVLLSAAAKYIAPGQMLQDIREVAVDLLKKQADQNPVYMRYRQKAGKTPIRSAYQFTRVLKLVEPYYSKITIPVCIVQGKKDGIVPFQAAEYLYDQLGSEEKELIFSDCGKHHICYSDDCDDWFEKALSFLNKPIPIPQDMQTHTT